MKRSEIRQNKPFAACHSRGTKPPCWDAKVAMGQDQLKAYIILNGNFFCFSCPSATFASQHGGFVPREWHASCKGPIKIIRQNSSTTFLLKKKRKNFIFALIYVAKKILHSNYFNTDFSFFSRNENRAKLSVKLNRFPGIWPSELTVRL